MTKITFFNILYLIILEICGDGVKFGPPERLLVV